MDPTHTHTHIRIHVAKYTAMSEGGRERNAPHQYYRDFLKKKCSWGAEAVQNWCIYGTLSRRINNFGPVVENFEMLVGQGTWKKTWGRRARLCLAFLQDLLHWITNPLFSLPLSLSLSLSRRIECGNPILFHFFLLYSWSALLRLLSHSFYLNGGGDVIFS